MIQRSIYRKSKLLSKLLCRYLGHETEDTKIQLRSMHNIATKMYKKCMRCGLILMDKN